MSSERSTAMGALARRFGRSEATGAPAHHPLRRSIPSPTPHGPGIGVITGTITTSTTNVATASSTMPTSTWAVIVSTCRG